MKCDITNAQCNNRVNQEIIGLDCIKGRENEGDTMPDSKCSEYFTMSLNLVRKKIMPKTNAK